jgi:hypothetical protein
MLLTIVCYPGENGGNCCRRKKCAGKDGIAANGTKIILLPKQDLKAPCGALQADK